MLSTFFHALKHLLAEILGPDSFKVIPEVLSKNIATILPVAFVGAVNTLVSVYAAHSAGDMRHGVEPL